jgi:hypothetical protein
MAQALFNKEIAELYGRLDKPEAQKIYQQKAASKWQEHDKIEEPNIPWYRSIFE